MPLSAGNEDVQSPEAPAECAPVSTGQISYNVPHGQAGEQRKRLNNARYVAGLGQEEGGEAAIMHGLGMPGGPRPHCVISDPQLPASDSRSAPWSPQHGWYSANIQGMNE